MVSLIARLLAPRRVTSSGVRTHSRGDYFYLGEGLALTRLKSGRLIYVDPQEESVCVHLIAEGRWESWVEAVVLRLLRPGDHVVEIGAHVGYYTIAMADKVGPAGSVTSYEANPRLAKLASRSLSINGLSDRAVVHNNAVSNVAGPLRLMTSRRQGGGGHLFVFENAFGHESEVYDVEAVVLDDVVIPSVRFIRIDAEGSESLILRGASRLLARPDLVICMEWSPVQLGSRTDVAGFAQWLADQGFFFWRIQYDETLLPTSPRDLRDCPDCDVIVSRSDPSLALTA